MQENEALIRDVSDTAMWVAAYRADETDRSDALFRDPFARLLAGKRGEEIAARVKQPAIRFGVVIRTAVFDDLITEAVTARGFDTVLNLAAGLDSRPYRLDLPAGLYWIEVDMARIIEHKAEVLGCETPRCSVDRVALDLEDRDARKRLFEQLGRESERLLVVTEGLLSYLAPADVGALAEDLHGQPAFAEWMTDLMGGNVASQVRNAGDELKAGNSAVRFAPEEGPAFFAPHGWTESAFYDLVEENHSRGRDTLLGHAFHLLLRVLPQARRARLQRVLGIVRLENAPA